MEQQLLIELAGWLGVAVLSLGLCAGLWRWEPSIRGWLPKQRRRAVPWTGIEVIAVLLIVGVVVPLVSHLLLRAVLGMPDLTRRQRLWTEAVTFPVKLVILFGFLRKTSHTQPYQVGCTLHRCKQNVGLGILIGAVLTSLVNMLNVAVAWCYLLIVGAAPAKHPLKRLAEAAPELSDWCLIVLTAVVLAPLLEELLFRGLLQPWLMKEPTGWWWAIEAFLVFLLLHWEQQGPVPVLFVLCMIPLCLVAERCFGSWLPKPIVWRAICSSSLIFACLHVWPTPIALFFLGLGLGYLAYRTQSLVGPIVMHGLFNAAATFSLLFSH